MKRTKLIEQLRNGEEFDLCVIGGGISGLGSALDAQLRGLKTCVIEKGDFASGTSSKSTKLIHGGVRYLESAFKDLDIGQLRQVKHGLHERAILLQNAPHLAAPLALLTPVFNRWQGVYYAFGMHIYRLFAGRRDTLPRSRWLTKEEIFALMPHLNKNIKGAVAYYDGQMDDARYALAVARSANEVGASLGNYLVLEGFERTDTGRLQTAFVRCAISGAQYHIKAKVFLNCTGPYSDTVRLMANPALGARISASKGVHVVMPLPYEGMKEALLIPKTPDGRVLFAIPFEGKLLVGTTDTPYLAMQDEPLLLEQEVDFILETLAPYLEKLPLKSDITAGFGGLRPLVSPGDPAEKKRSTKTMLRDHEVEHDAQSGLVSLLGGKWTTYRLMAQDAVNEVEKVVRDGATSVCATADHLLSGAMGWMADNSRLLQNKWSIGEKVARHLNNTYGQQAETVLMLCEEDRSLSEPLLVGYPFLKAEVLYHIRYEMAMCIRDVLARRLRLEILDWEACKEAAPIVANYISEELGWDDNTMKKSLTEYLALLDLFASKAGQKI